VGALRPTVGVDGRARSVLFDAARTVFEQQRQGTGASRSAREPNDKLHANKNKHVTVRSAAAYAGKCTLVGRLPKTYRRIGLDRAALFEHPKEQVLILAAGVVLRALDINVAGQRLAAIVANVRHFGLRRFGLERVFLAATKDVRIKAERSGSGAIKDARGQARGLLGTHAFGRNGARLAPVARLLLLVERTGARILIVSVIARAELTVATRHEQGSNGKTSEKVLHDGR
jgi:hypothetical protein